MKLYRVPPCVTRNLNVTTNPPFLSLFFSMLLSLAATANRRPHTTHCTVCKVGDTLPNSYAFLLEKLAMIQWEAVDECVVDTYCCFLCIRGPNSASQAEAYHTCKVMSPNMLLPISRGYCCCFVCFQGSRSFSYTASFTAESQKRNTKVLAGRPFRAKSTRNETVMVGNVMSPHTQSCDCLLQITVFCFFDLPFGSPSLQACDETLLLFHVCTPSNVPSIAILAHPCLRH